MYKLIKYSKNTNELKSQSPMAVYSGQPYSSEDPFISRLAYHSFNQDNTKLQIRSEFA
jgi:hypothetical protein